MRVSITVLMAVLAVADWSRPIGAAPSPGRPETVAANPLWKPPPPPHDRDLFNGPWGAALAPDPTAVYTLIRYKEKGVNPGVVVRDPHGRVWHVKQPRTNGRGDEGPVEVVLSRLLSAMGYHQPPVYYVGSFRMHDGKRVRTEPGGRFRLTEPSLRTRGNWSWKDPTVRGTRPYNGLLATLLAFSSWDLKDSNNEIYEVTRNGQVSTWYVVRDLGGALGDTGKMFVKRNNIEEFEREPFIDGWRHGFVHFAYDGKRPDLLHHQITIDDLRWATTLLDTLTEQQWQDAFRAGGYDARLGERFIRQIQGNLHQARQLSTPAAPEARGR